jgi:hypothetical protein
VRFTALPKNARDWDTVCFRTLVIIGFAFLLVLVWARAGLPGPRRQLVEEVLWPFPLAAVVGLVLCGIFAFIRREWLRGWLALIEGVALALVALYPIISHEAIYD